MKHVYRVHPIIRHIAEYSSTENLLNSEFTIIHCRSEVNHCVEEREREGEGKVKPGFPDKILFGYRVTII